MRHVFRFLGQPRDSGDWKIQPDDADHATKVLRLKAGTLCEVTDGLGRWCRGALSLTRDGAFVEPEEATFEAKDAHSFSLGIGALRFKALDEIIPSLVELGIDQLHVFHQAGTDGDRLSDRAQGRWTRIIEEAVKQSKRAWLPRLTSHASLKAFLDSLAEPFTRLVLDPDGDISLASVPVPGQVLLLVGGERGFDAMETQVLAAEGFKGVRLAKPVLRATTAAVGACAVMAARKLGDFR